MISRVGWGIEISLHSLTAHKTRFAMISTHDSERNEYISPILPDFNLRSLRRHWRSYSAALMLLIGGGAGTGAAQTYSLDFSNSNMSMFDPAGLGGGTGSLGSFRLESDIPRGVANIGVGGVVNTLFAGRYGAEAGIGLHGTVGVDFNFNYYDGSLDVSFPQDVTFTMDPVTATNTNTINVANVLTSNSILTASTPSVAWDVQGDIDLALGAHARACFGGCISASHDILNFNQSFTLLDFNQNRDDKLRLFGQNALSVGVEDGIRIPISRNLFLSKEDKITKASVKKKSDKAFFDITLGAIELNQLNLSYHEKDANGFTVGGANASEKPIAGLYADVLGIGMAAAGLPFNPLDLRINAGPLKIQGKLFQLLAGGKFGLEQEFSFDPNMMVTFHANYDVAWNGGDRGAFVGQQYSLSLDKEGGLNDITFDVLHEADAPGLAIVPEIYLQNPTLTNHTAMTFGPSVLAEALELSLKVGGIGLQLGPAFAGELIPSDIKTDIDLFNETVNIGNQEGLSTRYFMPSLTGVGGGPKELTAYANVDVARGSLVFETPRIAGSVTLRDQTIYRNASSVTIDGRLELVAAPSGSPNLYFGDGIESLSGIIRVGANSILDATGSQQDIFHDGSPSNVGEGRAWSNFIGSDNVLKAGILDISGDMYYNGHAIESIDSPAGVVIHGDGRIYANNSDALANLANNHGVLSIQNHGSVDTAQTFSNHGLMSVVGDYSDWSGKSTFRSNGYTNNGVLEIGERGQVDTTGVNGDGIFSNVDASGTLTHGTFVFSGGELIYNGPMIKTNETTLLLTGLRETDSSFVHRSGEAGSFIDTNGLAEFHTNKGSLYLQATGTASTEITFSSLTNTAEGHIVLDVTNEFESSSGNSHLYVTNGFTNDGLLELTDNVKGTIDTNINQVTSGWFRNNGTVRIDPSSTIHAGSLSNIDNNGRLSGGEWRIAGRFYYDGGYENMLRSIGQDTTLALGNGAEFRSRDAGSDSLEHLEHIQGKLIIADDKHTIGQMLINDGELILSGLLDGTGHANSTVLITGSLLNRGTVFLNSGAKLSVAGNLADYELQDPEQVAEHRQHELLVQADGHLRDLGDVTLDGQAQLFYGGYDIKTIGTGTKLTFSGETPNARILRLTWASNNLDSYGAHDALRDLEAITGELHLTNGARFGDGPDVYPSEVTLASGGALTVDTESEFFVSDGSTLHVASRATLLNDGILHLKGTSSGATLNFTGFGSGDAVLTGTGNSDDVPSGVITLGHAVVTLPEEDEIEHEFIISREWMGSGAITTEATTRLINQDQFVVGTGTIDTGTLLNRGVINAEGDSGLSITARQNLITNAGTFVADSGTPENGEGMRLAGFGGDRLTFYNFETAGDETSLGHIDVKRNLFATDTDIIGGSLHVAETGKVSLMNASLTDIEMSSNGQLHIEANGTSVFGGDISLNLASETFVNNGANFDIAAGGTVTNSGRFHLADGASVGGTGNFNNSGIIEIDGGTVELGASFSNRIHMIFDSENIIVPASVDVVNGGNLRLNNSDGKVANFGQINVGAHRGRIDIAEPGDPVDGYSGTITLARDIQLGRPVSGYDEEHAENVLEDDGSFGVIQLGGAVYVANESIPSGWGGHGVITGSPGSDYRLTNDANTIRGQGNIGDGLLRIDNAAGGTIEAPTHAHLVIQPNAGGFTNEGAVRTMADGEVDIIGKFNNFSAANATLDGGNYDVAGTLRFDDADVQVLAANLTLRGSGQIVDQHGANALADLNTIRTDGSFTVENRVYEHVGGLTNHGSFALSEDATFLIAGQYSQVDGTTKIDGTFAASEGISIGGGTVTGAGILAGDVINAGTFRPGNSPGITTIQGDYLHETAATLSIEVGGSILGDEYDHLAVEGDITLLGGVLEILPWNGFMPQYGDTFTIFSFTSLIGTFDTIDAFSLDDDQRWDFNHLYSNGTVTVIPEPSTIALIFGGLALGGVIVRKKREKKGNGSAD